MFTVCYRYARHIFLYLISFVFLFSCAPTQKLKTDSIRRIYGKQNLWPHEKSDLSPDPALVFGRLENGFRYVLMKSKRPRGRVSMHLDIQSGSMEENDNQKGIAHFLEHMVFNGSEHFKPGEMVKYFQSIGMEFGPDANAHTGFYETVYDIFLPENSKKSIEDGFLVLKDYAQGALLLPSEIDSERKVILAEKRARDSESYRTFVETLKFELDNTRISQRIPIGSEEVIKKADRPLLKDYYDTWYRPERMVLVLTGDFDPDMIKPSIEKYFGSMSPRAPKRPEPDAGYFHHKGIRPFYHYEKESGKTEVTVQVIEKIDPKPDSLKLQTQYLIRDMANQMVQNRIDAMISHSKAPFTSASIDSGVFLKQIRYSAITADCEPDKWEDTLFSVNEILRQALKYGFTPSEFERVKKDYLADLDKRAKNAPTRESTALARKIIRKINSDRVFQSPYQRKAIFAPIIKKLTLDRVFEEFGKMWDKDHRLVLVTGNAILNSKNSKNQSPEKIILSAYEKSLKLPVKKPKEEKKVSFPYLPVPGKKGRIIRKNNIKDSGIIQIDFENGVRLNLKKTDFKANQVVANLNFGLGRACEPYDKPGLAKLSESVVRGSGLGRMTKDELERALAGKSTGVNFAVNQGSFSFEARSVTDELDLLFQLLYANLVDPGFRQDAFKRSMEKFTQKYKKYQRTVEGAMTLHGKRFLAGGDSRFGLPPYDKFKTLKLDDIKNWLKKPFENAPVEISVVGDFDIGRATELCATYFGSLKKRDGQPMLDKGRLPEFPVGKKLEIAVNSKIEKGVARVAFSTDDIWDIKKTRRLSVLSSIFSDRLREVVREKLGATYSPYAYNSPSRIYPGYGVFHSVVSINPKDAGIVIDSVLKISDELASGKITRDELKRALKPTLTSIRDMKQKNGYWLYVVLTGSKKHPEQLDWPGNIYEDYKSITVKDMVRLAKKYLDRKKAAVIIIKPEK